MSRASFRASFEKCCDRCARALDIVSTKQRASSFRVVNVKLTQHSSCAEFFIAALRCRCARALRIVELAARALRSVVFARELRARGVALRSSVAALRRDTLRIAVLRCSVSCNVVDALRSALEELRHDHCFRSMLRRELAASRCHRLMTFAAYACR